MNYEEKTIYKETKAIQWCKEGLAPILADVSAHLLLVDNFEDLEQLLKSTQMDIEAVLDAVDALKSSLKYFVDKKDGEDNG